MRRVPGAEKRSLGDARVRFWLAAMRVARYLGARSIRGLLIGSVAWFGFLTIGYLASGRPISWKLYAESAGGYIAGCIVYRSAKRALTAWAAARQ